MVSRYVINLDYGNDFNESDTFEVELKYLLPLQLAECRWRHRAPRHPRRGCRPRRPLEDRWRCSASALDDFKANQMLRDIIFNISTTF